MMRSATRHHLVRTAWFTAVILMLGVTGWAASRRASAAATVRQLQTARDEQLSELLVRANSQGAFAQGPISTALKAAQPGSREALVNRLALLPRDASQRVQVIQQAVETELPLLMVARSQLGTLKADEVQFLVGHLQDPNQSALQRLRAAILLSARPTDDPTPPHEFLESDAELIVEQMLAHAAVAPQDNNHLIEAFQPSVDSIVGPLIERATQPQESPERSQSTAFTIQFLRDQPDQLVDVFLDASFVQHPVIFTALAPLLPHAKERVRQHAFQELDPAADSSRYDARARRKGVAAALLHRLGEAESTWSLFRYSPRPNVRSYLINRIGPLGGDFAVLLTRFSREPDSSVRRALLAALGGFQWKDIPEAMRSQAIAIVKDTFENDPDVGTHSLSRWLLLRWNESQWVDATIQKQSRLPRDGRKNWYVNSEGHTMAIFDARDDPNIGRVFAISTDEVSVQQFLRFRSDHTYYEERSPTVDCPVGLTHWVHCVAYCRWLNDTLRPDRGDSYPTEITTENVDHPRDEILTTEAYRLPTAAEWRFAFLAETKSRCYFGDSTELADDYYWHYASVVDDSGKIRYHPAATKLPNDWGMFSMYDGVREWCHDSKGQRRYVMGSASSQEARFMSSERDVPIWELPADLPLAVNGYYGLRVARTIKGQ